MAHTGERPYVLAVVPARYASTRFPGKIIADLAGKPLVLHAYERACQATLVDEVVIATDAPEVAEAVAPFGAQCTMTRADHPTGTDRIAEIAAKHRAEIIVNVQGDEALLDPKAIDQTIQALLDDPGAVMATARHPIHTQEQIQDPNVVKCVTAQGGRALYFSRAPIPHIRDQADRDAAPQVYWQHIGLYVYRKDFLLRYAALPQTPLEQLEKLEQLRVLEHGYSIAVIDTNYEGIGVDVPEDLERVKALLAVHPEEGIS